MKMSTSDKPTKAVNDIPGGAGGESGQPGQPGTMQEVTLPNGAKILCISGHGGQGGEHNGGRGGKGGSVSVIFHNK